MTPYSENRMSGIEAYQDDTPLKEREKLSGWKLLAAEILYHFFGAWFIGWF